MKTIKLTETQLRNLVTEIGSEPYYGKVDPQFAEKAPPDAKYKLYEMVMKQLETWYDLDNAVDPTTLDEVTDEVSVAIDELFHKLQSLGVGVGH